MGETQTDLYPDESPASELANEETTWVLAKLEVYNWGPFAGYHVAEFDARGTAIIGPTGSGKTTLVDALMTLLVAKPRYNLASTGGHESDRTLMSYVRGVLGGDGSDGAEDVARSGKTVTGICATYQAGEESLRLAGLMWIDGTGTSTKDLKRRWIFSQANDQTLEGWLRLLHGEGVRELLRVGRETARHRIFDSKKAYLAHTRKFFDVGENAFTLLNRAAGLKQLNSIDEIFRELVLDDRSAFDRALEVASEFDNLAGIHSELVIARQQQQSLEPVASEYKKLNRAQTKKEELQSLSRILPVWFAVKGREIWQKSVEEIVERKTAAFAQLEETQRKAAAEKTNVDTLFQKYMSLGGDAIGDLERTIGLLEERVIQRKRASDQYLQAIKALRLDESLTLAALEQNKNILKDKQPAIQQQFNAAEGRTLDAKSSVRETAQKLKETAKLLEQVRQRPGSNIPPKFHDFRAELSRELSLTEDALPFLAELVEVKPEHAAWRGAIERAMGSERLRVLVPAKKMKEALRWVNGRDNRLHVRLQEATSQADSKSFFSDGYTQKLTFKDHPLINTAKDLLSRHDRHCVESAEELRSIEHGLTIEGTMSGRRGKFEKQDQRKLGQGWMTGFDNKDQLESLSSSVGELKECLATQQKAYESNLSGQKEIERQLALMDQLVNQEFSSIDLVGAQNELTIEQKRRDLLLDPDSDTSRAKTEHEAAKNKLDRLNESIRELDRRLGGLATEEQAAQLEIENATQRVGDGLTTEELAIANSKLPVQPSIKGKEIGDLERKAASALTKKIKDQLARVSDHERHLIRHMGRAKQADTGALADFGEDLADIEEYLARLKVLKEEALPKKLKRFLSYLNESSDQGVTQLLERVKQEVDSIEHRIGDLNKTLLKVNFHSGRYLQLDPIRIKHERLRTLETAQRKLRSAALKNDEGESHYKALRELVAILREAGENQKQKGSRALLDPRYRLEFYVVEVDRETGSQSPRRSGSQSGSGGEKELMASHILTASLSYALCPSGAKLPLYGTVVLDEAFSKSSRSAATRIVEALRIFGLHPVFVTPNKEIGLLKQHTRQAICVHRPKRESCLSSISWEELEGLARLR